MRNHLTLFLFASLLTITNSVFAQPSNDNCSNPTPLTIGADEATAIPVSGTTINATASAIPTSVCSGSWYGDDVWYSFTTGTIAPPNGVTIKVIPGTLGLLGMAVYSDCDTATQFISCMSQEVLDSMNIPFLQSNTTYYIRMWSGGGATTYSGTFDIIAYERWGTPNQLTDVILWGDNPGEGDFNGGLNGWTSNAITTGDDWVWEADATSNGAYGQNIIISPTAYNGVMLFDADFMTTSGSSNPAPVIPYPQHTADLLSPIINCSGMPPLSVKFHQLYRALNGNCYFSYSIDGGQNFSTPININPDIAGNSTTPDPSIKRYYLPDANESSQVQLKFTADMDFYVWMIDDVHLVEKEKNNLAIMEDFVAIAPTYAMPTTSIDTIRFLANVANIGVNAATNVALQVDVVRDWDSTVVFSATNHYGTIMAGDTIKNQVFNATYLPLANINSYTVTYTLYSDSIDLFAHDNTFTYPFEVVYDYFDKTDGANDYVSIDMSNHYTYGTTYYVYEGSIIEFLDTCPQYISSIGFEIGNPQDLAGESITILVEKPTTGNQFIVNPITNEIESTNRTLVGIGTYIFTGNETANAMINGPISLLNGSNLVSLESNMNYIVAFKYNGSPNANCLLGTARKKTSNYKAADFAASQAGVQRFSQLLDVNNTGNYNITGFPDNSVPRLRLNFFQDWWCSTNTLQLNPNTLHVFPNPADDFITANIDLETMAKKATLTIYNLNGQIVETRNLSDIKKGRITFDLKNYISGTYFMSIKTKNGYSMKQFVVAK